MLVNGGKEVTLQFQRYLIYLSFIVFLSFVGFCFLKDPLSYFEIARIVLEKKYFQNLQYKDCNLLSYVKLLANFVYLSIKMRAFT